MGSGCHIAQLIFLLCTVVRGDFMSTYEHLSIRDDHTESLRVSFAVHCAVLSWACSTEFLIRLGC